MPDAPSTASGSSFYAAMRVLPAGERQAMFAIYDFCRSVDDVADGLDAPSARIAALEAWRADVDAMYRGVPTPRMSRLTGPVKRYDLRREDFLAIIDGVQMDAVGDIVAPDLATLDLYCDRVASAVGRLSVRVFGMADDEGAELAHELGRALQLTNILRDIDEDGERGRLYLPREALRDAGIVDCDIATVLAHPGLDRACTWLADHAFDRFRRANRIMVRHPLRVVRAPMLMAKVYETILRRLLTRGFAPPRRPVRASRGTLLWTVVRYGLVPSRSAA